MARQDDDDRDDRPRRSRRRDQDDDEPRKPANRGGVPAWVWVLIGVGASLIVCCAGSCGLGGILNSTREAAKRKSFENATAITKGVEHRVGDIGVTVVGCNDQWLDMETPEGFRVKSANFTVIELSVRNYNSHKNADIGSQVNKAIVKDSTGAELPHITTFATNFPRAVPPEQIPFLKARELRSDLGGVKDLIVVDRVPPAIRNVILYLDASAYGGSGYLKVDLPLDNKITVR